MPQRPAPRSILAALTLALLVAPAVLVAQYTVPGSLADLPSDRKERVEEAAREARWGSGRLRLEPWVTFSDAGYFYEDEVQADGTKEPVGDFSAAVGAGLRAYLRSGSRLIWAAHGKLDYIYWHDREERRTTLGQYGLGLFGEAGRLGMEVTATRAENQELFTAESLRRAPNRSDNLRGDFDLKLGRGFVLRFGGGESRFRVLDPEEQETLELTQLDRDERRVDARIGYGFRGGLSVSVGYEGSETDFLSARDRSNDGTAYLADVTYETSRLSLHGSWAEREIESREDSTFGRFDGSTWRFQLGFGTGRRFSPVFYAQRDLGYTLDVNSSYSLDERYGASFGFPFGRRTSLNAFVETGEQEYRTGGDEPSGRVDDLFSWGATAQMTLGRGFTLYLGYRTVEYDSNLPGQDREERLLAGGLRFGGKSQGPWY